MTGRQLFPWIGGKARWADTLRLLLPDFADITAYRDCFLGSGGMFYSITDLLASVEQVTLIDLNPDIINAHKAVRDAPDTLAELVAKHQERHSRKYVKNLSTRRDLAPVEDAARFVYFMSVAFNATSSARVSGASRTALCALTISGLRSVKVTCSTEASRSVME